MNARINDFIGVFPNAFDEEWCDQVIRLFKIRTALPGTGGSFARNTALISDMSLSIGTEDTLDCYDEPQRDPSCTLSWENAGALMKRLDEVFWNETYPQYASKYPILTAVEPHRISCVKVQKTLPQQGYHVFHCEHGGLDTGRRLLFLIVYLNDVAEGGETEFLFQSQRVEARRGTMLIAPAGFTHTHRGNPPLAGEKYIVTTWVEFS